MAAETAQHHQSHLRSSHDCRSVVVSIVIAIVQLSTARTTTTHTSASAFAFGTPHKNGAPPGLGGRLGTGPTSRRSLRHERMQLSRPHAADVIADADAHSQSPSLPDDAWDEFSSNAAAAEQTVPGTVERYVITKVYTAPPQGFRASSLSVLCSARDTQRLGLGPHNVTLPVAMMLLDPDAWPTPSRARKSIRQRAIRVRRRRGDDDGDDPPDASALSFEAGRVDTRVCPGDAIGVQRRVGSDCNAVRGAPYRPPPFEVPVAYEDDHMAIVDKPAGVVMYRDRPGGGRGGGTARGGHGRDTLLSALPFVLRPSRCDRDERQPQPVHRLDRPVSGLVVVAKTKAATAHLSRQFEARTTQKTYFAIVNGCPDRENGSVDDPRWSTIDCDLDGKPAITKWRTLRKVKSLRAKGGWLTLVELKPKTGRYHQLRRHMVSADVDVSVQTKPWLSIGTFYPFDKAWVCNTPIVGDTTYDNTDSASQLRRRGLFLCSAQVEVEHPHYNTPSGRTVWRGMGCRELCRGDALMWQESSTDTVMVKARVNLPRKFESFLRHEDARATKLL